jgi:hypothetical protein
MVFCVFHKVDYNGGFTTEILPLRFYTGDFTVEVLQLRKITRENLQRIFYH